MSETSRIAVVDDHGIVRFGYRQLINREPGLHICGMVDNERDGLEMIRQETPDLAIVDLSLKQGDGLDLIKAATKILPILKILVISAHDESFFAHRVLVAGARGYINKEEAPERLIEGIQSLLAGKFYFSEAITSQLIRSQLGNSKTPAPEGIESLTNRELQVFEQIGKGRSTRQIADAMCLSVKTVERHKENIKQKLGMEHAAQLAQHATQWVLGKDLKAQR